ncbi:GNAT family N-acetyltransferase [Streptomyces sp. BE133]|uniref:GNAT family N-acetyltransferase n=1 Tax=Streptomyces sp. BE133 TaxID=3002523 RepID=UPI002E794C86|nr:GNAT family N-acetyltransferase [Streptomyces sp. BE133]MEE1810945.1 GNAT family N-acetyltransferase [Streptomyces sp. BE133]
MAPADAHTDAGTGPAPQADTGAEDTLDLPLSEELLALFGEDAPATATRPRPPNASASSEPDDAGPVTGTQATMSRPAASDLLDHPADWGPVATPAGVFQLVPVRLERDVAVISRWMNDPAVAAFWELAGSESVTADHLRPQLGGDGRSVPCLGVLAGVPMSYWEIYRADLDPLARHYPARPHDTGIHLLIGGVNNRGRGVGTTLLRAVSDLLLDNRPLCARVVAEPDLRNTPSVSAFLSAGFRFSAEVELPDKRAALMVRDRTHRAQL